MSAENRKVIPPIGAKGIYTLLEPYNNLIRENEVYECAAIRYFTDLSNDGKKVFDLYYKPYGLLEEDYLNDKVNGQVIVTLISTKFAPAYIPSSFIKNYPSFSNKNYSQVVLTASLGPLPDDVILEPTMQAMRNVISDFIGVQVNVNIGIMPLSTAVTPEEHADLEATRLGAIRHKESDYGRVADLSTRNEALQQKVILLEKIIKDYGLLD